MLSVCAPCSGPSAAANAKSHSPPADVLNAAVVTVPLPVTFTVRSTVGLAASSTSIVVVDAPATPLTPLTVIEYAPAFTCDAALSVIVAVPDVVTIDGVKAAVTPLGRPLADKVTGPAKPANGATVTV